MLELSERQKTILNSANAEELERITRSYYGTVFSATELEREALLSLLKEEEITEGKVQRSSIFKSLMENTLEYLTAFAGFLLIELRSIQTQNVIRGMDDAIALILRGGNILNIRLKPNSIPLDPLVEALNLLNPTGPLMERIRLYNNFYALEIRQGILDAIRLGLNPLQTAGTLRKLYGMPLTSAINMARTVQLYSYRRAAHANYRANEEVVSGWIWTAKLDSLTCMSCVAQHGTFHSHDEELNDHHQGRCSPIPSLFGFNPVDTSGQDWFGGLTEEEQKTMMGKGKYALWKEGKITLDQLSITKQDEVYGEMKTVPTLKSFLGD